MKTLVASIFVALLVSLSASFALAVEGASPKSIPEVSQVEQSININTADVTTLTSLKGIGEKKAQAIIAWREANGDFISVDQLLEVKGIGAAILDANREKLRLK